MIEAPTFAPFFLALATFGAYYIYALVYFILHESTEGVSDLVDKEDFTVYTTIHGFIILVSIICLYIQEYFFINLKLQGYSFIYKYLINFTTAIQYFLTFVCILVMVILVIVQSTINKEHPPAFSAYINEHDFEFLFSIIMIEMIVFSGLILTSYFKLKSYIKKDPAPDTITHISHYSNKRAAFDDMQDIIDKLTRHLYQLQNQLLELEDRDQQCKARNTSPEFERLSSQIGKLRAQYKQLKQDIAEKEREINALRIELKYLDGSVQGKKRQLGVV